MAKRTKKLLQIDETTAGGDGVRLNRYLSDSGACSRREADRLIEEGHVTVDGVRAGLGMKITDEQTVLLDGMPVKREEKLVFIALNKPKGIVCTTDRREKDNIIDFLKFDKRIYPVGRLDKDSEGLILLTNDGSIVNKILRAGNYHEKEYVVTVDKPLTAEFLNGMEAGVPILDTVTRPCKIKALDKYTFQIILTQGLNRQIRRMCEYFDYKVLTLKRIRIMNILLGHLQTGGYRNVTDKEIAGLTEAIKDSVNEAVVDVKYIESMPARKDNKGKQGISYRNEPGNGRVKSVKLKEKNRELVAKESKYKKASSVGRQKSISRQEFVDKQESTDKLKFEDKQKSANERKFADKQKSTNASKFADKRKSSNGQKFADKQRIANDQKFTDKQKSVDEKKFADKRKSTNGQKFADKQRIANDQKFADKQKTVDEKKFADKQKSASGQKFSVKQKSGNDQKFVDKQKSANGQKFADKQKSVNGQKFADRQRITNEKNFENKQKSEARQKSIDNRKPKDKQNSASEHKFKDKPISTDKQKSFDKQNLARKQKSVGNQKYTNNQKQAFSHKENTAAKGKMRSQDRKY